MEYHLRFLECCLKNPNVLNIETSEVISLMKFKQIYILDLNLHRKQAFHFSKGNSYTNACLKLLFDAKSITSLPNF